MLVGALLVLVVLLAFLAVPIGMRFDVSWHGELEHRIDLSWAFGIFRKRLQLEEDRSRETTRPARRSPRRTIAQSQRSGAHAFAALRLRPFRRRLLRFGRSLWRAIHKDRVRVTVRLGLGDPADTGRLWALVGPCAGLLQQVPEVAISIEPDFDNASFELQSSGAIRVVPLAVLLLIVGLVASPSVWHGVRVLRRGS